MLAQPTSRLGIIVDHHAQIEFHESSYSVHFAHYQITSTYIECILICKMARLELQVPEAQPHQNIHNPNSNACLSLVSPYHVEVYPEVFVFESEGARYTLSLTGASGVTYKW